MGNPSPKYTPEFKQQAVALYKSRGGTYAEIARELEREPALDLLGGPLVVEKPGPHQLEQWRILAKALSVCWLSRSIVRRCSSRAFHYPDHYLGASISQRRFTQQKQKQRSYEHPRSPMEASSVSTIYFTREAVRRLEAAPPP